MRTRSTLSALLMTALLTMALAGLLYLGRQLLGTPFVPSALYAWLVRGGAYAMPELTMALAGASPARDMPAAEWLISMLLFFIPALLIGWLMDREARRRGSGPDVTDGLIAGGLFGAISVLVSLVAGRSALHPMFQVIWLAGCFLGWGIALSEVLRHWAGTATKLPDSRSAAVDSQLAPEGAMDRRRFLLTLGASTAAVTAISAVAGAVLGDTGARYRLPHDFPTAGDEFRQAQARLLAGFRRFAIVRIPQQDAVVTQVLALGAEYPDQHYVSVWLGEGSPIVIYETLESALAAHDSEGDSEIVWLD